MLVSVQGPVVHAVSAFIEVIIAVIVPIQTAGLFFLSHGV